nr:LINE-type retrotransposon LIb DNA [Ipomoea batatas]
MDLNTPLVNEIDGNKSRRIIAKINVNHKNPEAALRRKGNQFEALATLLEIKEENPRIPANNNLNAEGGGSTKNKAPIPANPSQNTPLPTPANVAGSNPTQRHSSNTSTRGRGGRQSIGKGRGKGSGTGDVSFNAMFNMTSSWFVNVENIGMFQFSGLSLPTKEHTTVVNRLT